MPKPATGTAWERNGIWYYCVRLPLKPGQTRRERETHRLKPRPDGKPLDKKYAHSIAQIMQAKVDSGESIPKSKPAAATSDSIIHARMAVIDWCRHWIKSQDYETVDKDKSFFELYLKPYDFAQTPLAEAHVKHVIEWVRSLKKHTVKDGKPAAARTIRSAFSPVQRALAAAVVAELIKANPCAGLRGVLPEIKDKKAGARATWKFTASELLLLCTSPKIIPDRRALYAILFLTGMRYSEAAALRWRDLDETTPHMPRLTISRAISSVRRIEAHTKTHATKLAPVIPTLLAILRAWRAEGWAGVYGRAPTDDDLIVPTRKMTARDVVGASQTLHEDCDRLGLRHRHTHSMRRTFASLAQDFGGDAAVLRWVTHAPPKEAFALYTTLDWSRLCTAVMAMERALDAARDAVESSTTSSTQTTPALANAFAASLGSNGDTVESNSSGRVWGCCNMLESVCESSRGGGVCAHIATGIVNGTVVPRALESALWAWDTLALASGLGVLS